MQKPLVVEAKGESEFSGQICTHASAKLAASTFGEVDYSTTFDGRG